MKKINICVMLLLMAMMANSQSKVLEPYFQKVLENNPEIDRLKNELESTKSSTSYARALPDPEFMASYFLTPMETRLGAQRAAFSLSQMLPWPGKREAAYNISVSQIEISNVQLENAKLQLWKDFRMLYYDIYYQYAEISLLEERRDWLKELSGLTEIRVKTGQGSAVELLQIEMALIKTQTKLDHLGDHLESYKKRWDIFLNEENAEMPSMLYLWEVIYDHDHAEMEVFALENNLELKRQDAENKKLMEMEKFTEYQSKPDVTLGMSYTIMSERQDVVIENSGMDAIMFPQIGLKIPINQKKYQAVAQESHYKSLAGESMKNQMEFNLKLQLEEEMAIYHEKEEMIKMFDRLIQINQDMIDLMAKEYAAGRRDLEDLLKAQDELIDLQIMKEQTRVERQKVVANIDYSTGLKVNN